MNKNKQMPTHEQLVEKMLGNPQPKRPLPLKEKLASL